MIFIVLFISLAVIAYLLALYSEKLEDKNRNYVPDEAEEMYFSLSKYMSEVYKAFKDLIKVILRKNA